MRKVFMENDFDSVSWQNESDGDGLHNAAEDRDTRDQNHGMSSPGRRKSASDSGQAEQDADDVDLAGIGNGTLDCKVNSPLKENDGTKDAYVSYLVITEVRMQTSNMPRLYTWIHYLRLIFLDRFQIFPETFYQSPSPLHRFCISLQRAVQKVSRMRRSSPPRQTQNGVRPR